MGPPFSTITATASNLWSAAKVILQLGVIVWWAALIYSRVGNLTESVGALNVTITQLQNTMQNIEISEARLEVRLDNVEKKEQP